MLLEKVSTVASVLVREEVSLYLLIRVCVFCAMTSLYGIFQSNTTVGLVVFSLHAGHLISEAPRDTFVL